MDNDVNIANCGSVLPRMTHSLFDPSADREHPQVNFRTLLTARRHLHGQILEAARRHLGDETFRRAWTEGADLSYAELIDVSTTCAPDC
ncbi:MAG: hypothetical protein ABW328_20180 [Ilumatobacteraceae bacterium]